MQYIVSITKECEKEAIRHSILDNIYKLKKYMEDTQSIHSFDRLDPYYKKKVYGDRSYRIIMKTQKYTYNNKEYIICIFLKIFVRSDKDYIKFFKNTDNCRTAIGDSIELRFTSDDQADIDKRLETPSIISKEKCSSDYLSLLGQDDFYKLYQIAKESIYESYEWGISIGDINISRSQLFNNIYDIYSSGSINKIYGKIYTYKDESIRILYTWKDENSLYLLTISDGDTNNNSSYYEDDIIDERKVRLYKYYPAYCLRDEKIWFENNNLVLSKEEKEVAELAIEQRKYPIIIDGHAGSGKTTMIQYIFVEYCTKIFLKHPNVDLPVYLTYSKNLRDKVSIEAKKMIQNKMYLLQIAEERDTLNQKLNKNMDQCFKQWHSYLGELIGEHIMSEKFHSKNYMSYNRFKKEWAKTRGQSEKHLYMNADMSWHVIRTFIKGYDFEGYTDSEDYDIINEKSKIQGIDAEKYKHIYDDSWSWYKKLCEKNSFWDDQDLARYILNENLVRPKFSAIFCDESQDFTKIELEIIFKSSYFSDKDINQEYFNRIPFVFAGDENQTLSPTGFRWDSLKEWFTQKFFVCVNDDNSSINKLTTNYRSPNSVVKFCNLFQLFRVAYLGKEGLQPQHSRDNEYTKKVFYFNINDPVFWEELKKNSNAKFILPCEDGGEDEYIKKDIDFRKYDININAVTTAHQFKGLENSVIILYKFSKEYNYDSYRNELNPADRLSTEYFINKCYVAASRTTELLIILDDTEKGIWKLYDTKVINELKVKTNKDIWKNTEHIESYSYGNRDSFSTNSVEKKRIDANNNKYNGIDKCEVRFLEHAITIFKEINYGVTDINDILDATDKAAALECQAYIYFFTWEYTKAIDLFKYIKNIDKVVECHWLLEDYENIVKIRKKSSFPVFYDMAKAIISKKNVDFEIAINSFKDFSLPEYEKKSITDDHQTQMEKALSSMIVAMKSASNASIIFDFNKLIKKKGYEVSTLMLGYYTYRMRQYELALDIWNENPQQAEAQYVREYTHTQAMCTRYPDNIKFFMKIEMWNPIISEYEKYVDYNLPLKASHYCNIAKSYFKDGQRSKSISLLENFINNEQYISEYLDICENDSYITTVFTVKQLYHVIQNKEWHMIQQLLLTVKLPDTSQISMLNSSEQCELFKMYYKLQKLINNMDERAKITSIYNQIHEDNPLSDEILLISAALSNHLNYYVWIFILDSLVSNKYTSEFYQFFDENNDKLGKEFSTGFVSLINKSPNSQWETCLLTLKNNDVPIDLLFNRMLQILETHPQLTKEKFSQAFLSHWPEYSHEIYRGLKDNISLCYNLTDLQITLKKYKEKLNGRSRKFR